MIGLASLGLLGLGGCDDDGEVVGVDTRFEYSGNFVALNASGVAGVADVIVDEAENDFEVSVEAGGLDANITHAQHIHSAATCPTMSADANSDGFLDVVEGIPAYGGILIPLDSDLTDQEAGDAPSADASGEVDYGMSTTFDAMIASVSGSDSDAFVELEGGAPLAPQLRTVVLHGVVETTDLPETVQTLEGLPATATLPVACAQLELESG